ncbi:ABC transporter ATP-binding protein [Lapidilactobacillus salsurivasis]
MIISAEQLSFGFHRHQLILENANLTISAPGVYGLVAPNGHGKTTFFGLLCGLLRPQTGTISLFDQPNNDQTVFENISYCPSIDCLFPTLTGRDHLRFIARSRQLPETEITQIAEKLQLTDIWEQQVKQYSLGMQQRLVLAMSLLPQTPLILLDEPLNGIDPTSLRIIREELVQLGQSGRTVLVASHDLTELSRTAQQICFLVERHFELVANEGQAELEDHYSRLFENQVRAHV